MEVKEILLEIIKASESCHFTKNDSTIEFNIPKGIVYENRLMGKVYKLRKAGVKVYHKGYAGEDYAKVYVRDYKDEFSKAGILITIDDENEKVLFRVDDGLVEKDLKKIAIGLRYQKNATKKVKPQKQSLKTTEIKKEEVKQDEIKEEIKQEEKTEKEERVKLVVAPTLMKACINCRHIEISQKGWRCNLWGVEFNLATVYTCEKFEAKM